MNAVYASYAETPSAHPFTFTETGLERGEDVNGVIINYKTTTDAYMTAYEYNPSTGLFERYRNGYAYTDGNTAKPALTPTSSSSARISRGRAATRPVRSSG